jgi:hypothetical protein
MTRETVFQVSQLFVIFGVLGMTSYTEPHVEPLCLIDLVHVRNVPVTGRALKPALYVPLVVEMDVTGHGIDLVPGDRLFLRPKFPDLRYLLLNIYSSSVEVVFNVTAGYVGVTAHAFLDRRYSGNRGHVHEAVAVLTGELIAIGACVNFMTEPDRLSGPFTAAFSVIEKIKTQKYNQCQNRH